MAYSFLFTSSLGYAQPYAYVANAGGWTVAVVNTANYAVSSTVSVPAGPSGIAVTPDGSTVYVSSQVANTASAIRTSDNSVHSIGVGSSPTALAISPNGALVYVVDQGSNQVTVISNGSQTVAANIGVGSRPTAVAFSPDSSRAYVTNLWDNSVSVINTATNSVSTFGTGPTPVSVAVSPDGQRIYVATQGAGSVTVHDTAGNIVQTIGGFSIPVSIAITPDGSRALVVNQGSYSVSIINTASNTVMAKAAVGAQPTSIAISTDGSQAYVSNEFGFSMTALRTSDGAVLGTVSGVGIYPSAIATVPSAPQAQASVQPPAPVCNYSISSSGASYNSAGGVGYVTISAPAGCAWTAGSNSGWLSILYGSSGSGSGTLAYAAGVNSSTATLTGSLSIAGQTFSVTQSGVAPTIFDTGAASGYNLAVGKPASQSSAYPGSPSSSAAVDGNTDGNYWGRSVMHTAYENSPWWQVDLGTSATVGSIVIWNRTDCCNSRLSDYWVFVSNTPFNAYDTPATLQGRAGTWSSHQTQMPSPTTTIAGGGAQGRYVRVQLSGADYLSLAEVQVIGSTP